MWNSYMTCRVRGVCLLLCKLSCQSANRGLLESPWWHRKCSAESGPLSWKVTSGIAVFSTPESGIVKTGQDHFRRAGGRSPFYSHTCLHSFINDGLVHVQGSAVSHHCHLFPQRQQHGCHSNGSGWAVCLVRRAGGKTPRGLFFAWHCFLCVSTSVYSVRTCHALLLQATHLTSQMCRLPAVTCFAQSSIWLLISPLASVNRDQRDEREPGC